MGFNIKTTELLFQAKKLGIDYSQVATLGRQTLNGSFVEFERLFVRYGYNNELIENVIQRDYRYSENFLKSLGAQTIETFDASDYEGASKIWDMNLAIPEKFKESYSLVIDSGSLEHIFNFPQAIKNCMEMVREGGHMFGITPSNNFLGHGFYQFSPELFYRIFSRQNGFELVKMWLFFPKSDSPVYEVLDPMEVKSRVTLANIEETFLFYIAKRTELKEVFKQFPQQSDYEQIVWKKEGNKESKKISIPKIIVPFALYLLKKWKSLKIFSNPLGTGNKKFFKKVKF